MSDTPQTERPDVRAFLDLLNSQPGPRTHEVEPEQARAMFKGLLALTDAPVRDIFRMQDFHCPGPAGDIGLRLYDDRKTPAESPVILFFHGGGFVIGDLAAYDSFCAEMAHQMQLPVVSVDYRLAPEAPFPAAPDDCEAAARWIADNGTSLGIELSGLISCGDSAGGNLAIVTSQALRDHPASEPVIAQFPIYPVVDDDPAYSSIQQYAEDHFLTLDSMRYFGEHTAAPKGHKRSACIMAHHGGTPPTVVMTAGLDPLRDQGREYAAKLASAGATVAYYEANGNIHGCISMRKAIPSTEKDLRIAFDMLKSLVASHG